MNELRRFTEHQHGSSGTWYVYDHMVWRPYVNGYETEEAARNCANSLEREWKGSCLERQQEEVKV